MIKLFLKQPGTEQPPEDSGSPLEVSIPTAQRHEKLIKQIKNQQEIIALPKDSHNTNPSVVAEKEARQLDAVAASDNEDQSDADFETLDHRYFPALH